jgi:O-methyltransferase
LWRRIDSVGEKGLHTRAHIMAFVDAVLAQPVDGVLVECGAYRGVSAAKFSHLADMLGRELVVFDSFRGLPPNDERHTVTINGKDIKGRFRGGEFAGSLEQVRHTVECYGVPNAVRYVEGWFADTLPPFAEPVAGAYLDCDLAASTRTCLDSLWPLVTPGGCIVSQDGDFPLVVDVMRQWAGRADPRPIVTGLGEDKMVTFGRPL